MTQFEHGQRVLLTSQKGKKWLIRIADGPFSCHLGTVDMNIMVGMEEGDFVETNKNAKLFLFRPTLRDYIYKLKRRTQIIYPKDLGTILFYADIHAGLNVLESGIGSGAMSLALIRATGRDGSVVSIEKRLEFAHLARRNIEKFFGEKPPNHRLLVADIQDVHLNELFDRAVIDLPEPWLAIENVSRFLKRGALLVSLSPNVGQVQETYKELRVNGYTNASTFEMLKRNWKIDERRARPVDRMVAHTGFITVAKKVI